MYKITINVLEQPSHEALIQASVNSGSVRVRKIEGGREGRKGREGREGREGRDGGKLENKHYKKNEGKTPPDCSRTQRRQL